MARRRGCVALMAAVLILAGCDAGDDSPAPSTSTTGGAPTSTGSPSTTAATPTTAAPAPTSTAAPAAPPLVTGLTARTGGGSDEVVVTWPPLPDSAGVESYRLSRRDADGTERTPANSPLSRAQAMRSPASG